MMLTTRLAPSPTGALHLGNARTFLVNWLLARQRGWKLRLRIEDIDSPRIKRNANQQLIDDLRWIGLDWDEEPVYQSLRLPTYARAINELLAAGIAYPCVCSRKEVELAASAPHAEDGAGMYPGTCRGKYHSVADAREQTGRAPAVRFAVPEGAIDFIDQFAGPQRFDLQRQLGDFIISKSDGTPAYQLAVVADDVQMGVTHIVRGDDLLDSTPRQMLIYRALGFQDLIPHYYHLPLIVGIDGRRLAKRHGDTRLSHYRQCGVSRERLLALLARWCGISADKVGLTPQDLLQSFRIEALPAKQIRHGQDDEAFLLADLKQ